MKKFFLQSLIALFLLGTVHAFEPCAPCSKSGPYFSIDYLYWKFEQEQLYFTATEDPSTAEILFKEQNFEFSSGFRAGIGYQFACENCDIGLDWTRFRVNTDITYAAPGGASVVAIDVIGLVGPDIPSAQAAEAAWHLDYDILDLNLGWTCLSGNRLALHPTLGVRAGRINQTQNVFYTDVLVSTMPDVFANATVQLKNDFSGAGLLVGVDGRFNVLRQLGIFSSVNGALLYGYYNVVSNIVIPATNALTFNNSRNGAAPVIQMLLGADWVCNLCHQWPLRLGVGYEMLLWWNMFRANNNLVSGIYINYRGGGDLISQGLTIQASLVF